ncbi:MAG: hypothetical protein RL757_43, partial [Bacteroidota bacterium]
MKINFNLRWLGLLLIAISFAACRKGCDGEVEPSPPKPAVYEPFFECKINGTEWKAAKQPFISIVRNIDVKYSPFFGLSMTARKTNGELLGIDTKGYGLFDTLPIRSIYSIDTLGIYAVRNISKSDDTLNRRFPYEFRVTKIDTAQK